MSAEKLKPLSAAFHVDLQLNWCTRYVHAFDWDYWKKGGSKKTKLRPEARTKGI